MHFNKAKVFSIELALIFLLVAFYLGRLSVSSDNETVIHPTYSFHKTAKYIVSYIAPNYYLIGQSGAYAYCGSDDDYALQYGINDTSASGGSVYVEAASYNASVILKDNVTLWLSRGVSGITVSIDSGANCTLIDEQNAIRKEYKAGVLWGYMNWRTGEFWWNSQNITDIFENPELTASYIVFQDGSYMKMKNCTTQQIDWQSTTSNDILTACIGNLTNGGIIYIKDDIAFTGTYTITKSRITICTGETNLETAVTTARVSKIVINSSQNDVHDVLLQGIVFRELYFYACNTNCINGITIRDCRVSTGTASNIGGVFIDSDNQVGSYTDGVVFDNIHGALANNNPTDGAFLTVVNGSAGQGNGNWFIQNSYLSIQASNASLVKLRGEGFASRLFFANNILAWGSNQNNNSLVSVAGSTLYNKGGSISFTGGTIECHNNSTLVRIQSSTVAKKFWISINNIKINAYTNLTLIDNQNSQWASYTGQGGFDFTHNRLWSTESGASIKVGIPNESTYFPVTIEDNIGFVTENSGTATNCVNGTWVSHGLAGTPTTVTLTISGSNYINSTAFLLQPTVIAKNSTHFQIGFYLYDNGTITAVTATNQKNIFYEAEYKP